LEYLENLGVTEEDVVMRLFAHSLTLDARDWNKALATNNISGWITFHDRFMDKWSHKQDNALLLKSFSLIKKNENESMKEHTKMIGGHIEMMYNLLLFGRHPLHLGR
jgi:hypothetical protein